MKKRIQMLIYCTLLCFVPVLVQAETEGFLKRNNTRTPQQMIEETLQLPAYVQEIFFSTIQIHTGLDKATFVKRIKSGNFKVATEFPLQLLTARIVNKEVEWWREVEDKEAVLWVPDKQGVWVPASLPACGNPVEKTETLKAIATQKTTGGGEYVCEDCNCMWCEPIGPPQYEHEGGDSIHYRIGRFVFEEATDTDVEVFVPVHCVNLGK